jgi:ubiquitin-protein ligase
MLTINKRLLREYRKLVIEQENRPLLDNDFLVSMDEDNTNIIKAIIKPPRDSIYRHKFIRLDIEIDENYPYSPPSVKFVNFDGVRIHPNMYECGKCCATILNTWGDNDLEKWTSSMGIETILVTFHSFLDNNPYTYEPGGRDNASYTDYVKYQSWITCLIRYLERETDELFNQFIGNYLLCHIDEVFDELDQLSNEYPTGLYLCPCFEIDNYYINFDKISSILQNYYMYIDYIDKQNQPVNTSLDFTEFLKADFDCSICYDTNSEGSEFKILDCQHKFHKNCLERHINNNQALCPMCRSRLVAQPDTTIQQPEYIISPLTHRRVKKGTRTYKWLLENNHIQENA